MQVRESRENRGISQGELARRIDFSQSTLSKIESGERPLKAGEERLIEIALEPNLQTHAGLSVEAGPLPAGVAGPPAQVPNATSEPEKEDSPPHSPKPGRRAYICASEKCKPLYRRFVGPDDPIPSCLEHGRMVVQANWGYKGLVT